MGPFGMYPSQLRPYLQPFGQETGIPYYQQQQDLAAQSMLLMPTKTLTWGAYDPNNMPQLGLATDNQSGLNDQFNPLMGPAMGGQTEQIWDNLVNGKHQSTLA